MGDLDRGYRNDFRHSFTSDHDRGHRLFNGSAVADYDRGFKAGDYDRGGYKAGDSYDRGYKPGDSYDRAYQAVDSYDRGYKAGDYDRGYRSNFRSYDDGKLEIVKGSVFSANQSSYVSRTALPAPPRRSPDPPLPVASRGGGSGSSGGGSGAWCFSDPEMKRRKRVASYKAYTVEGKLKTSLRKGYRWIKVKCSELVNGW